MMWEVVPVMRLRCVFFSLLLVSQLAFSDVELPAELAGIATVNLNQAYQLYRNGALFVDVRSDTDWNIGRIDGAVHLDFQRDFGRLSVSESVSKDTPMVIYCNSIHCLRAAYASAISVFWGFRNVYYFRDGYYSWMTADLPVEMGLTQKLMREKNRLVERAHTE